MPLTSSPLPSVSWCNWLRVAASLAAGVAAAGCGDDGDPAAGPDAAPDAAVAADAEPPAGPSIVAEFDGASFQLPESVAFHAGAAYASFLSGQVVKIEPDGEVVDIGAVAIDPAGSAFGLGIAVAGDGAVYLAMARASAASPFAPGIYRIPPEGGAGTLFASHPTMTVPNDLAIDADGTLYITDGPAGALFRKLGADPGDAEPWLDDPLLDPSAVQPGPCGARSSPFPIGANGIVVEPDRVLVGNTEHGAVIAIPIEDDGAAGAPAHLLLVPGALCGIDGLTRDDDGSLLATVLGSQLVRIAPTGTAITTLHAGLPLRTPAGVDVGTFGAARAAIVVSPDFEAAFGPGGPASAEPNLVSIPLAP